MIEIANDLKADYLMYGSITIESDKGQNAYHVTVTLLAVNKKGGAPQSVSEFFPVKEAREDKLKGWARKAYKKLTGQESSGTLVVKANVDGATVLVDREPRGTIKNGSATLQLDENRYNIAIEAEGYKRYEFSDPITIRAGDTTTKDAELEKRGPDVDIHEVSGTVTHESSGNGKKIATIAGLGVGVALGVLATVEYLGPIRDYSTDANNEGPAFNAMGKKLEGGDCGLFSLNTDDAVTGNTGAWVTACKARRRQAFEIAIGATAGAIGVVSGILWLRGAKTGGEHASTASKGGKIAVTPVVTPSLAGATLQIEW
jgi:PEGA domain-containing protein